MLRKLMFLLIFMFCLVGCVQPDDKDDIFQLNITSPEVYKNIEIVDGKINSEYYANCENIQLEYVKKEKFSGPSSYNYLIKSNDGKEIYVIDQKTFVYDNYKCEIQDSQISDSSFQKLEALEYFLISEFTSLNLIVSTKVELRPNSLTTLYLKTTDKLNAFFQKMNELVVVKTEKEVIEESYYTINYDSNVIKVIDQKYIIVNETKYELVKGNISFLYEYNSKNTDSNQSSSGWLPWV